MGCVTIQDEPVAKSDVDPILIWCKIKISMLQMTETQLNLTWTKNQCIG
jgi:hypothetical protein